MTDAEFTKELSGRGFTVLIPGRHEEVTTYGWIDLGGGHLVNRWNGGSTKAEQLRYCIETRKRLDGEAKCEATVCSSRWKKAEPQPAKAAKPVAKKAAKKAAKVTKKERRSR